jgi:hypothetical protein
MGGIAMQKKLEKYFKGSFFISKSDFEKKKYEFVMDGAIASSKEIVEDKDRKQKNKTAGSDCSEYYL